MELEQKYTAHHNIVLSRDNKAEKDAFESILDSITTELMMLGYDAISFTTRPEEVVITISLR